MDVLVVCHKLEREEVMAEMNSKHFEQLVVCPTKIATPCSVPKVALSSVIQFLPF